MCGLLVRYAALPGVTLSIPSSNWLIVSSPSPSSGSSSVPLSLLEFGLARVYTGLVHVITTAMSSYVHLPCCILQTPFPYRYPPPVILTIFPPPLFQNDSWALGEDGMAQTSHLGLKIQQSTILCTFTCSGLSINNYWKLKLICWESRDALVYRYNDKSLLVYLVFVHPEL